MYERIRERFRFDVPNSYREMHARDLFDHKSNRFLHLSDAAFLSPKQIAEFRPLEFQIDGLVPFAKNARADLWCWYTSWNGPTASPVVFCPRDCNEANFFAPSFPAAVYRMLLEEFSGTWLADPELYGAGAAPRLANYVSLVAALLDPEWIDTLGEIACSPLRELEPGLHAFITRTEADRIVERDIPFPELNATFEHYR